MRFRRLWPMSQASHASSARAWPSSATSSASPSWTRISRAMPCACPKRMTIDCDKRSWRVSESMKPPIRRHWGRCRRRLNSLTSDSTATSWTTPVRALAARTSGLVSLWAALSCLTMRRTTCLRRFLTASTACWVSAAGSSWLASSFSVPTSSSSERGEVSVTDVADVADLGSPWPKR